MALPIAYLTLYDISRRIMLSQGQPLHKAHNILTKTRSEPFESTAQATYLLPRLLQKKIFLQNGYVEGTSGDYGLVRKAVGNRNIPIYQTYPDQITRDKLTVLGNYTDKNPFNYNISREAALTNAGSFPTAIYVDSEGNLYQKSWDLNDYGNSQGGSGRTYNRNQWKANLIDVIGSPVVVTTGFQPLIDSEGKQLNLINYNDNTKYIHNNHIITEFINNHNMKNYDGKMYQELPEIIITPKHKKGGKLMPKKRFIK